MKIVFLEPLGLKVQQIEAACEGLKKAGHEVVIYPDRNENLDELKRRAEGAEVVIESNIPLCKDFLDACPNLKMLSIAFTGLDHIDMEECERRDVKGLYARARKGEVKEFTGISAPFEVPENPMLEIDTSCLSLEESVRRVVDMIMKNKVSA